MICLSCIQMLKSILNRSLWHNPSTSVLLPVRLISENYESSLMKPSRDTLTFDIGIVGGGIIGLATARELKIRHPNLKMCLVEKEKLLALHQTGHNSGVIHAGIYYAPGSLKAKLCVEGLKKSYNYLDEKKIPYKKCGKLIVATDQSEVIRLNELLKRGEANEVRDLKLVDAKGIKEIEPNCIGIQAIHSPHTGIVDWRLVALSYGKDFKEKDGKIFLDFEVTEFSEAKDLVDFPVVLMSKDKKIIQCKYVIICAGLYSDKLAIKSGCSEVPKIVPFRGDYLVLKHGKQNLVRGNIYPVPDPKFPFLGVHFTPRIDGNVWLGPNAVLALKREGYGLLDFSVADTYDALSYSGMRKLAIKHLNVGVKEVINVALLSQQIKALKKFIPSLNIKDVSRGPSGVRAQALDPNGELVDDFVFQQGLGSIGSRLLNVINAPSPAATSSLSIARMIVDKVDSDFKL